MNMLRRQQNSSGKVFLNLDINLYLPINQCWAQIKFPVQKTSFNFYIMHNFKIKINITFYYNSKTFRIGLDFES